MRMFLSYLTGSMLAFTVLSVEAQTVEKVADLNFVTHEGIGIGGYAPLDRFTQNGTNLWFTTKSGGVYDAGTISRFDLVTHEIVEVASLDNNTGKAPESWIVFVGETGYFTTVSGGVGNKGTIAKVDVNTGVVTPLYAFPADGSAGSSPRAGLTQIGDDLWTTTSLGGSSSRGTVVRYNLTSGILTVVANFDGPLLGGQPFDGLVKFGDAWYFSTFTGGTTFNTTNYVDVIQSDGSKVILTNKLPLGAGTLGKLSFSLAGDPVVKSIVSVPGGYEQFPALEPTPVGTNSLYFTSTGPNSLPGAILRYDLDSGLFTNLFSFPTNAESSAAIGTRPGYSGLVEWQGELYFINRAGGTNNTGTVAKYNIASNTVVKLADLDGGVLGSASGFFGTGAIVEDGGRNYIYYPITAGGAYSRGTIIRVALPPGPIVASVSLTDSGSVNLTWTGGYAPFSVEGTDAVDGGWTNVVQSVSNRSIQLPIAGPQGFYRIVGSK